MPTLPIFTCNLDRRMPRRPDARDNRSFEPPGQSTPALFGGGLGRSICLLVLILFSLRPAAAAEPAELIQSVIQSQMKAFNDDDYPTAYTFAAESIRGRFSKERFEAMVRAGYPQIAKSSRISFGEVTLSKDRQAASASVRVTGKDHVTVVAQYQMLLEGGAWKIGGVMILEESRPIGVPISIPPGPARV